MIYSCYLTSLTSTNIYWPSLSEYKVSTDWIKADQCTVMANPFETRE